MLQSMGLQRVGHDLVSEQHKREDKLAYNSKVVHSYYNKNVK